MKQSTVIQKPCMGKRKVPEKGITKWYLKIPKLLELLVLLD